MAIADFRTSTPQAVSFSAPCISLPFHGNRLKEGWQISLIEQNQTGNPLNFKTSTSSFTGNANLRPNITGPVITGFFPATNGAARRSVHSESFRLREPGQRVRKPGQERVTGPGWSDLDIAIAKKTQITERFTLEIRADAFDSLNQVNFTNPVTSVPAAGAALGTFGVITGGTRYARWGFRDVAATAVVYEAAILIQRLEYL